MAKRRKKARGRRRPVSAKASELFNRLPNTARRATDRSSEALAGACGAAICLLIAYGLSIAYTPLSFVLIGPIAACIGLPLSVLAWRGLSSFRQERYRRENRLTADEILNRIKSCPKDTPPQLIHALWVQYYSLTAALQSQHFFSRTELQPALSPPKQNTAALPPPRPPPFALPPPTPKAANQRKIMRNGRRRRTKKSNAKKRQ
jgi:hypothetical protein